MPRKWGRVDADRVAEPRRASLAPPANIGRDDRRLGDVPRGWLGTVGDLGRGETGVEMIATDDVNACMKCNEPAMSLSPSAITGVSREEALPPRACIWGLWWGLGWGPWRGLWQAGAATNRCRGAGGTKVL